MSIEQIKQQLARVFDDNLDTVQWKNYVDYAIMGCILLSTLEIFLSTYEGVVERYGIWLSIVDWATTIFFTIEVTLRIWCADVIDDRYKGVLGRLRYCFSFYGLIDILSTYPFYLQFMLPVAYPALKSLRIMRIMRIMRVLRIFRYTKSLSILARAMRSCKNQMLVSLQFLFIVTILLSFILFFVEHDVQPDVYDNGFTSVLWAFMQYIGDPGGFADTPPITVTGRIIASIIGILGIAIFAVPAGLIGSAFSDVMTEDEHNDACQEWTEKLLLAFERKLDRPTGLQISPRYVAIPEIQARMGMKEDDILDAIRSDNHFRLINLACTQPAELRPVDKLAVEYAPLNTVYGCLIDRGSRITITAFSNVVDPIAGWWAYYLAKIGGFNYISKELGQVRPYQSFYQVKSTLYPNQDIFMEDLNRLLDSEDKWVFNILPASGSNEPEYPEQFHFSYGAKKGDTTFDDPGITLNDTATFTKMFKDFKQTLNVLYGLEAEKQLRHNNANSTYYARHLDKKVNAVSVRIAWSVMCWDMRAIQIAQSMAQTLNKHINHCDNPEVKDLMEKDFAYNGYTDISPSYGKNCRKSE